MPSKRQFKENPSYAGRKPQPLTPACHDGTHMMDVECSACGNIDHLHESSLATIPENAMMGYRCQRCSHVTILEAASVRAGFAEMRRRGWIA